MKAAPRTDTMSPANFGKPGVVGLATPGTRRKQP